MVNKLQRVSIDDLRNQKDTDPIWALNNTSNSKVGQAGDLLLLIPKLNGNRNPDPLRIPRTWLPVNITNQIPRRQLLESSEFLNAVNNEVLVLITQEYADYLMKREGAEEERQRLQQLDARIQNLTSRAVTTDSTYHFGGETEKDDRGFDPKFMVKVTQWKSMADISVLNDLRSLRLTRRQYEYVLSELKNHPKTCAAISRSLAKHRAK